MLLDGGGLGPAFEDADATASSLAQGPMAQSISFLHPRPFLLGFMLQVDAPSTQSKVETKCPVGFLAWSSLSSLSEIGPANRKDKDFFPSGRGKLCGP